MSQQLKPGAVISVSHGLYRHKGVVTSTWPRIMVIHASKARGHVVEEPLEDFAEGRSILVENTPELWQGQTIVDRARTRLGQRYVLSKFNCEDLVTFALGHEPHSAQLAGWILVGLLGLLVVIARA